MASVKYDIEVQVSRVSVSRLLAAVLESGAGDGRPASFVLIMERCGPALQGFRKQMHYLKKFSEGFLIGVKVKYPEEIEKECQHLR